MVISSGFSESPPSRLRPRRRLHSSRGIEVVTRACALTLCVLVVLQLVLDAETVRMPSLPLSEEGVPGNPQGLFEVCVCPSGKLFLSKAGVTSTCSEDQDC